MKDIAIKVENLSKCYKLYKSPKDRLKESLHPFKKKYHKQFFALKNIDLEIKKGEILGIVGKNGAGKSTLLKLISGIIQPSSGRVAVNGKVSSLLGLGSGLNPEFNGIQNIQFNCTIMGFSKKEIEEKTEDIISFADIGNYIDQPLKTYSSGMKMRLGFAIGINMAPEILIIDEVLAVGDELFRRKCYAKMEELFKSGCTVLYVSHAINTINEMCTRAIFIDKGELILEGPPKFVTLYYQKFLYVKSESPMKIRNRIIEINKNNQKKMDFLGNSEMVENKIESNVIENKKQEADQKPYLIQNFIPKSTVVDKNYDVEINEICITTLRGEKVNVLVTNEEYILSYKAKFNVEVTNFAFPWVLKSRRGSYLSGVRYPGKKNTISKAQKNQTFHLKWKFKCNLLNNIYFVDVGVVEFTNDKKKIVIAIYDALVFKVQKIDISENDEHYWAVFNMGQKLENPEIFAQ